MWLFKVAENDLALRHCDNTSVLFQRIFPDNKICQGFTMSCQKTSYIFQDGFGPLSQLCASITSSPAAFTLMFDETTTTTAEKTVASFMAFLVRRRKPSCHKIFNLIFLWESNS